MASASLKEGIRALAGYARLQPEEQQLLDQAAAGYESVQRIALELRYHRLTDMERELGARPTGWERLTDQERSSWRDRYGKDPFKAWCDAQNKVASLLHGGPFSKSALLRRLLLGKPALRWRPPTSFSYPWYDVVESATTQMVASVRLSGPMTMAAVAHLVDGATREAESEGEDWLLINQTPFLVSGSNEAAKELLSLAKEMERTPDGEQGTDDAQVVQRDRRPIVTPRHALWEDVIGVYKKAPEFEVRHGEWPAWQLRLGRKASAYEESHAVAMLAQRAFSELQDPHALDISFAWLDAVMEGALEQAVPVRKAAEKPSRIDLVLAGNSLEEKRSISSPFPIAQPVGSIFGRTMTSVERRFVRVSSAQWELHKTSEWERLGGDVMYLSSEEMKTGRARFLP